MKARNRALMALALIAAPGLVGAQAAPSVDAVLSFSTGTFRLSGDDLTESTVNLVSDVVFSDRFTLGFDADFMRLQTNSVASNVDFKRFQVEPTLHLSNGVYLGAYLQNFRYSTLELGLDSMGGFAGYDAGSWAVEGYMGSSKLSENLGLLAPELRDMGVTLTLRPLPNLQLYGHLAQLRTSHATFDVDLRAIGGQLNFDNGAMVFATAQSFRAQQQQAGVAIGAGYDLARLNSKLAGTITLEMARNDYGGLGDATITKIAWVMPIGKAKAAPVASIARIARGGVRNLIVVDYLGDQF